MMFAKKARQRDRATEPNFWASYSDLMAGMLLVFILLLVVSLFHYAELTRTRQEILDAQEARLKSFHELQRRLVQSLSEEMGALPADAEDPVTVDPETGVLRIGSGILFGEGEAVLREAGRRKLDQIFDAYIRVVLDDAFRDLIRQIEIEGHTNSNGTYLHNLELSQQRALTVMTEMLARAGDDRERLQQMVIAGGRSFSNLILDEQGNEDKVASRRIEIHLRLQESRMFRDIYQDLSVAR